MAEVNRVVLANAELVLPEGITRGALVLEDGQIAGIEPGTALPRGAVDCGGDVVAPGLVELHTDNLERHLAPRPRIRWPHGPAIQAHDAELAGCGITTVFDAIRVGSILSTAPGRYPRHARDLADEVLAARASGHLKISHHLHLRAEVCSETLAQELAEFGPEDRIGIVSLMDHTPGQRQFSDLAKFEAYVRGKHAMTREEFDAHSEHLLGLQASLGAAHEAAAVAAAHRYGAVLASHDDTTADQVAASVRHGVTLAEFPTTAEAAAACRAAGVATMMGAPNLVRGGSHSGNVSAQALAADGLIDILSSDYVPAALLLGAVMLGRAVGDLAAGLDTVTRAPARAVALDDRGALAPGLRADVIRFAMAGDMPVLRGVWAAGRQVA